jgi:hypothetical protein
VDRVIGKLSQRARTRFEALERAAGRKPSLDDVEHRVLRNYEWSLNER